MIIRVTDQTINLEDETNLKAFHVDAGGFEGSERALLQFLDQIGQMEPPDHAWVTEEYLRNVNRGKEHQHVIDQLVEIAKKHDWYDDAAKAIKAHIEY